jgi:hypothetical protein
MISGNFVVVASNFSHCVHFDLSSELIIIGVDSSNALPSHFKDITKCKHCNIIIIVLYQHIYDVLI